MEKAKEFFEVVEMSDLSAPPIIEMVSDKRDFVWNGDRNEYFRFLIDMYNSSATWGAAVDEVYRLTYGGGLVAMNKEGEPIEGGKTKQLEKIFPKKDVKRFVKDRVSLGQGSLQVIKSGTGRRAKVTELSHWPVQTLAPKRMNEDGEIELYYYHPKWENYKEGDRLKKLPSFATGESQSWFVARPYCPNYWYWSPLQASGGLEYALLECEIAKYQVNDIKHGFSGTTLMNIQRNVENFDKREQMVYDIREKLSGSNGDKTVIFFNATPDEKTELKRFPLDNAPQRYDQLAQESARKILTAWNIQNPKLIGVPAYGEGNGFGNNAKELEVAFDMFYNKVIKPYQDEIVESIKEVLGKQWENVDLGFIKLNPVDFEKIYEREKEEMLAKQQAKAAAGLGNKNKQDGESTVRKA